MRLRNIPGAKEEMEINPYVIRTPESYKGAWRTVFQREAPLRIEVGMGKGRFMMEMASRHPDVNFIGIEMYSSVLLRALQKREEMAAHGKELQNLYFLREDARNLPEIFAPGEVDRIYLNFSDPWPKARHDKRRLTSHVFLNRYEKILKEGGLVEFKTDNRDLFDFSLEEARNADGWEIVSYTFDLHADPELCRDNVMTEYEEKFSAEGKAICKMILRKRQADEEKPENDSAETAGRRRKPAE